MAFDGFVTAGLAKELTDALVGGKIAKVAQPEADEILLTVKNKGENYRLLMSASASLPLLYLTDLNKPSPVTAPTFCMLLRKHIGGGRIASISQPGLERILIFEIEHRDEMGDLCQKRLIIELMGKHSNLIFCDDNNMVLDSIKRIPSSVSSVREVLPGRTWFIPDTQSKKDPLTLTREDFFEILSGSHQSLFKALYGSLTGFSPAVSSEVCHRASLDSDVEAALLSDDEKLHLFHTIELLMEDVKAGNFSPCIYYREEEPEEFSAVPLSSLSSLTCREFASISEVLATYYTSRDAHVRIRQKSAELRRVVQTALERNQKKFDLQQKQLKDTEKREKYRIYGELLNTYGYSWNGEDKVFSCINYYDGSEVKIPMDPTLPLRENANRFFAKYNKQKRTFEALSSYIQETETEVEHLLSIRTALDLAVQEADLTDIKEELREYGYIHKRGPKEKKPQGKSHPLHFVTENGFHIYVGKNNYQNEELTFKVAKGDDMWFHAKGIPGSHVIVKTGGQPLPDDIYETAASLAAYYSSGRDNDKVEIDYVEKKQVKKVPGAAPGFVIYHTNYSMVAAPKVTGVTEVSD